MNSSNRWLPVVGGVMMNMALGMFYGMSVFMLPLEQEFVWTRAQTSGWGLRALSERTHLRRALAALSFAGLVLVASGPSTVLRAALRLSKGGFSRTLLAQGDGGYTLVPNT